MQLPREMRFTELIHAADERVPVDALRFGTDAVFQVFERYGRSRCGMRLHLGLSAVAATTGLLGPVGRLVENLPARLGWLPKLMHEPEVSAAA